jgi:serine/threonine protein kinase
VYRARDTKLARDVAIKTLPSQVAQSPERLARFKREAQLLASLNHPHIAAIYELEEIEGRPFLVLELVEGEDLSERLKRGAIAVGEALDMALQVAAALEEAHEKGIVHRDLKPANIKLTADGQVKVLDFGLEKALAGDSEEEEIASDPSQSPTLTRLTEMGVILGTAAYMSPEQAKGKPVDRRADIWAFGCVLYEMLTGRKAFSGDDATETLASVIKSDIDLSTLPKEIHPQIRAVLRGCLEKKVGKRWHAIADVRIQLEGVSEASLDYDVTVERESARQRRTRTVLLSAASALLASFVTASALVYLWPPPERSVSRLSIDLPEGHQFRQSVLEKIDFSRDGRKLVYQSSGQLHLKRMNELTPIALQGTRGEQVGYPTFSPDGEWIAFWADGEIKKISSAGGTPVTLCDAGYPWGLSWSPAGRIFFGQDGRRFLEVSPQGGLEA